MMKPRKLYGWALIAAALSLRLFGDMGAETAVSMLLMNFAALGILAVGLVLVAT